MTLSDRDIAELGKDLLKPDATPDFLTTSLKRLQDNVKPTEDLLRRTKVGVTINKLKAHKDPDVQKLASTLVSSWRATVKAQESKNKKAGQPNGAGSTPSASRAGTPSLSTPSQALTPSKARSPLPPVKQEAQKAKVPPEKRDAASDGVDTAKTGDKARDGCLKLMYNGLAFMSEDSSSSHILRIAISIESAAFGAYPPQTSGEASTAYRTQIRSLFANLKNKSNPLLRKQMLAGEIPPDRFVRMTDEELKSPERKAEDAAMEKENLDKAMVAKEEKSISSSFTCGKCKQKRVSYTQAQTRSADEPMTTFCECLHCGNRWKFS